MNDNLKERFFCLMDFPYNNLKSMLTASFRWHFTIVKCHHSNRYLLFLANIQLGQKINFSSICCRHITNEYADKTMDLQKKTS